MKFGLGLFGISPRLYAEVAVTAEENGFESVWIPEHIVFPEPMSPQYSYSDSGLPITPSSTPLYDPWAVLSYVAAVTNTIRLGTAVYIMPLRHPIVTARSVLTVDRLSNGRVTVGMGVGWLQAEYEAVGVPFGNRGKRTDEIIPLLRRLWSEDVIEHSGEHYQFGPVRFEPKPRQKNIPIEIGGNSAAALRRAGRLGDGWMEIGAKNLGDVARDLATVNGHRKEAGRENDPFEVTVAHQLARDTAAVRECEDFGVTRVILGVEPADPRAPGAVVDDIKRIADEVVSNF